jgi:hypothetical protein
MIAKLNEREANKPPSDIETQIICAAVSQAYARPGVAVILEVPDSHRRVLAKGSELVGGVEYELIENGEVVMSGGGPTPSIRAPRKAQISILA